MQAGPLRVLMNADAVGGVWTYALDLAAGLAGHGVTTILAVLGPPLSPDQRDAAAAIPGLELIETGLPLDWTAESPDAIRDAGRAIADLARTRRADLVHLNSPALAAEAGFSQPLVAVCHSCVATWWAAVRGTPLPADFAWRTDLVARGYAAADALIAPSQAFADATAAAYGIAAPVVVHNGRFGVECFPAGSVAGGTPPHPNPPHRKRGEGIASGSSSISGASTRVCLAEEASASPLPPLAVGRASRAAGPTGVGGLDVEATTDPSIFTAARLWDEGKNIAVLDRAAARLDVPVRAAGATHGPNGAAIQLAHIEHLGTLTPDAMAAQFAARPIFCSPARYEPFGLAILEAAAAGCALVLFDIPTFRELWQTAAFFVAPDDDAALATALQRLIDDPAERARLGTAARVRAARYTQSAMVDGTLAVYRSLLAPTHLIAKAGGADTNANRSAMTHSLQGASR